MLNYCILEYMHGKSHQPKKLNFVSSCFMELNSSVQVCVCVCVSFCFFSILDFSFVCVCVCLCVCPFVILSVTKEVQLCWIKVVNLVCV